MNAVAIGSSLGTQTLVSASYEFLAIFSISLIWSLVQTQIRVATLLTSDHSADEDLGFNVIF
jgi:hypothetical protein